MNLQAANDWEGLLRICRRLRSPEGCNWDRAQSLQSLTPYLLEETHEVLEAFGEGDDTRIAEELGDLFYVLALMVTIAEEQRRFRFETIAQTIAAKLVRRHPHVFGSERQRLSAAKASEQWESIKSEEKAGRGAPPDRLESGARGLPALLEAYRVQEKAASHGFDWPSADLVLDKIEEEIGELREARRDADDAHTADELGDLFFALVNLARHLGGDPEQLLKGTTRKFRRRFARMEELLVAQGSSLAGADLDTMEQAWQAAKGDVG